ncbi:hypothetical protein [Pyxidicoccus trucidator]|uniref:hypothetical protein n=1 Tax=Pyxidicoccus trucidator TaxID=2709662 RepID=UPI0013D9B8B7|nr:hypothetical protein [Pyxidicoccus trucidator]
MRDVKQAMGVSVLLVSAPAWANANDMCELVMLMFLPPVFLWAVVSFLAGVWVRGPTAVRVWGIVLTVGIVPTFGAAGLSMSGAFHSSGLRHEVMLIISSVAMVALLVCYAWALVRFSQAPPRAAKRSQPV